MCGNMGEDSVGFSNFDTMLQPCAGTVGAHCGFSHQGYENLLYSPLTHTHTHTHTRLSGPVGTVDKKVSAGDHPF